MKTSFEGKKIIKFYEGLRLEAYLCPAGVWTIGYGHTGIDVYEGLKITSTRAEYLLSSDLIRFELGIRNYVKVALNQNQFDALVSFAYNVGLGAFASSTLLKKLNQKDYVGASEEFENWVYANGKVLAGLTERRKSEKELFLKEVN